MYRYALLGLLQGLTEFLPVSSSGHLVLAQRLLGLDPPGVVLEGVLHLATLTAVLLYFRRDIARLFSRGLRREGRAERCYLLYLALGTLPIAVAGLSARGLVERAFSSVTLTGGMLLVTAGLLLAAARAQGKAKRKEVRLTDAALVGVAQAAALLPGISRSGATIGTGILAGLAPREAARFSFLLAIPAILGAGALALGEAPAAPFAPGDWLGMGIAAGCALTSGLFAIHLLLRVLAGNRLYLFAFYCLAVGAGALALGFAG